ncbi:MAG: hypothetical protein WBO70_04280 [Erysipelotrichaceae bacterium]
MEKNTEFSFELIKQIGIISSGKNGWNKELTYVSWNNKHLNMIFVIGQKIMIR